MKLPVELSSQVSPTVRTKINRWLKYQAENGKLPMSTATRQYLMQIGLELASELELHYGDAGTMLAVAPEAVALLEQLPAMLGKSVPSHVTKILRLVEEHREAGKNDARTAKRSRART